MPKQPIARRPNPDALNPRDHIGIAIVQARRYEGRTNVSREDLRQEALVLMVDACQRWNPEHAAKAAPSTYIAQTVKLALFTFLSENGRLVSFGDRDLQQRVNRAVREALKKNPDGVDYKALAAEFGTRLTVTEAERAVAFVTGGEFSMHADAADDGPRAQYEDPEAVARLEADVEHAENKRALQAAFLKLSPREQHVISARFFSEERPTLKELASRQHPPVSAQMMLEVENRALRKLRETLTGRVNE